MGRLGIWELIIILSVLVLLFGAKKIPEIAGALGKALREFKKTGKEVEDNVKAVVEDEQSKKQS